ncbi:MAG: hypothetical protein HKN25_17455 [Pyrinomonadaceae bacterium]|nr:hypothetical protein [Pyrinomonadaceae bacterium]
MNQESKTIRDRSQRGGAGVKVLLVLVILVIIGRAAWNFVPVWYAGENLKQELATAVKKAETLPDKNDPKGTLVRGLDVLKRTSVIPKDAAVTIKEVKGALQTNIRYTRKVSILPFGIYDYDFVFNHTATRHGLIGT